MEVPVAEKPSAVEQLQKLDAERAKILETAKIEALTKCPFRKLLSPMNWL